MEPKVTAVPESAEPTQRPSDYADDGVDVSLIRAFLAMTPALRLQFVDDRQADLDHIREHMRGR
ncbi:MAG: hypothetical protein ACRD2D_14125 [Terriglobales bacterium]